jgi:hypothetical protein
VQHPQVNRAIREIFRICGLRRRSSPVNEGKALWNKYLASSAWTKQRIVVCETTAKLVTQVSYRPGAAADPAKGRRTAIERKSKPK